MSSRKRRIKRKIEMKFKLEEQCLRYGKSEKAYRMWVNAVALANAIKRKGWYKRQTDEVLFK